MGDVRPKLEVFKMKRQMIASAMVFVSSLCVAAQDDSQRVILANIDYSLTKEQVVKHSAEAMSGSGEAALKLVHYYYLEGRRDLERTLYWALIGAENGDAESQFTAFHRLSVSTDPLKQQRSVFWLKKAAEQDYLGARETLARCGNWPKTPPGRGAPCFGPGADH